MWFIAPKVRGKTKAEHKGRRVIATAAGFINQELEAKSCLRGFCLAGAGNGGDNARRDKHYEEGDGYNEIMHGGSLFLKRFRRVLLPSRHS